VSLHDAPTHAGLVLRALSRHPERIAFRIGASDISYATTLDLIGRMQGVLAAAGVRRGDMVAGLAANRFEAWCAGVAAGGLGAAITPLHPLASVDDHLAQVTDSESAFLVVDPQRFGTRAGELAARAGVRGTFTLGPAGYGDDLLAAAMADACSAKDLSQPDDIAALNYTGGTTGRAKGVLRGNREVSAGVLSVLGNFPLPQRPVYLAAAPISHAAGLFVTPVLARGGTVELLPGFDPELVIRRIRDGGANFTLLVPSMIYALLNEPGWSHADVKSLELLVYGASPMSPTRLQEGLERMGPVFCQLYGQTECYVISTLARADHDPLRPELLAAAGHPLIDCDLRLVDDEGREVESGERGEVCVRAPYAMRGYWKQPEQTAATVRDGWIHTGDVAWQDPQGRIYIVDRKKDMIVSGGFNIYPRDIEDVLTTHPAVAVAAVIGVPDEKWGEAVKAFVVLRPDTRASAHDLADWVRSRKGSVYVPKSFEIAERLPLSAVGKVDKRALRATYWADSERQVN
jgi:fatty-acyl-CoA synthase